MSITNLNRVKLSQLRALVAVAGCGNFSEAALTLDLSQSAVSHAIATLEEELGVQLLWRGRRGARLTPVGEQITERARDVLMLLEDMAKQANLHKGLQGGEVRIASFRSVATHILPPVMAEFQRQFPDIAVTIAEHVDYPDVEQALREGEADVGFTYLPAPPEFKTWEVTRDEYVVLLPPQPQVRSLRLSWEVLARYQLILPPEDTSCGSLVTKHLAANIQPVNVAYRVREDSTIVRMVAQGLGAAILPRLAAEPVPGGVQLCSLPVILERVIGVAVMADALQTPAAFAFLETMQQWTAARYPFSCDVSSA